MTAALTPDDVLDVLQSAAVRSAKTAGGANLAAMAAHFDRKLAETTAEICRTTEDCSPGGLSKQATELPRLTGLAGRLAAAADYCHSVLLNMAESQPQPGPGLETIDRQALKARLLAFLETIE